MPFMLNVLTHNKRELLYVLEDNRMWSAVCEEQSCFLNVGGRLTIHLLVANFLYYENWLAEEKVIATEGCPFMVHSVYCICSRQLLSNGCHGDVDNDDIHNYARVSSQSWAGRGSRSSITQFIAGQWPCHARTTMSSRSINQETTRKHPMTVIFISRSYCYTVWSAIGIILLSVCPSVCPSVCDAVHCGSQGRCRGLKVVPTWS